MGDDTLIDQLVRLADAGNCPPVDGSEASIKLLNRLYPEARNCTILPLEEIVQIEAYFENKRQLKVLEKSINEIENESNTC